MAPTDAAEWPELDRLGIQEFDRLKKPHLDAPYPLVVASLPRAPEPEALTPGGIQALRAAAADALEFVLQAVVRDHHDCEAVALAEALFEALQLRPPDDWATWREAHTACVGMRRAERRRLGLDSSGPDE